MPDRIARKDDTGWHISPLGVMLTGFFVMGSIIVGIAYSPHGFNGATTPVVMTLLSMAASTVPSVMGLIRADAAARKADEIHTDMRNGVMQGKMQNAVSDELDKRETRITTPPGGFEMYPRDQDQVDAREITDIAREQRMEEDRDTPEQG